MRCLPSLDSGKPGQGVLANDFVRLAGQQSPKPVVTRERWWWRTVDITC